MTRHKVTVNGASLSARVDGPDNKPWIVLSNSLGATADMWSPQLDLLATHRRVLRYDTRGHGESSATAGPYGFGDLVGDVVGLMDHFGIERADVMGLSLGGMTALGLGLDHPSRVSCMICADARADAPAAFCDSWDQRITAIRESGIQAIVDGTIERWFTPDFRARHRDVVESAADMLAATDPEGYIGCAQALKQLDYRKRLGELRTPVMYVVGSEDTGAPPDVMRAMADATPDGRFVVIDGAAHISNMENPQQFNDAVSGWLGLNS